MTSTPTSLTKTLVSLDSYELKPGDILLYRSPGLFSWLIRLKTWSPVSHVETYLGEGLSAASRDGIGVGTYPLRLSGLLFVLRPTVPFNIADGLKWHTSCIGQGYDWKGVALSFFGPTDEGSMDKQWCSEHATRFAIHSGYFPFRDGYDPQKVSPGMFLASPVYRPIIQVVPAALDEGDQEG